MAESRVQIIITGDNRSAVAALKGVEQAANSMSERFRDIGRQILGVAGGMALFEGVKRAIQNTVAAGLKMNAELEQATVQLKVLTGSVEEAQKTVKYLYDYAAKTPFEFKGVLQAASIVKGARLDMEKWIPVIGDMAAAGQAAGLTMDQVAMAIARVRSGNVGEFFERVGAYLGITREDLRKYGVEWDNAGALADRSAAGIQRVIEAIYQEATTRFKGMAEEQSNTFAGMWSTIRDAFNMIQATAMEPLFNYLKTKVLPAIRELAGRFQEAYEKGGLLSALKTVIPPELAGAVERLAGAWDSLKEAAQKAWTAVKPFATEMGRLALVAFGGVISASAELVRALSELIGKLMEIPGAGLAVQALATSFLLFRGVIPLVRGLGGAIMSLFGVSQLGQWVARAVQVMQIQWALGARAGASFASQLMAVFSRLGTFILGSINWWAVLAAAVVAAGVLIMHNWKNVGAFFSAVGKMIAAAMTLAKDAVIVAFEEMRYAANQATHGLVSGVASKFAQLIDFVLPLAGKILPDTWLASLQRASEAAKSFAANQAAIVGTAAGRLDAAKAEMGRAADELAAAWSKVKETGAAAGKVVWEDLKGIAKSAGAAFKDLGQQAQNAKPPLDKIGDSAEAAGGKLGGSKDAADKMREALEKLGRAAASVADSFGMVFSEFGRALGAGPEAAGGLVKQIRLAMVSVEEFIAAGGKRSGQALLEQLQAALNMLPWAVQEIGPKTIALAQKLAQAAAMMVQLPMEEQKKRGIELGEAVNELWKEIRDTARDYAYEAMQHIANIGGMTVRRQIEYLRRLLAEYNWNTQERWRLEEELYRKNLDLLNEQVEAVKKAYEDRLAAIDEETEREVALLEERLAALDEADKLADRERARAEHEKKLAELHDKRRYYEVRTGLEAQRQLAEIDRQIAEEEQQWQEQQHEWTIEDQKEQIQEEIDLVKQRGEERKKALEKEMNETLKVYEGKFKELTATLAVWEREYVDKFAEIGRRVIEALAAGQRENLPLLEQVRREIEAMVPGMERRVEERVAAETPAAGPAPAVKTILPGDYQNINGRAAMPARQLAGLLGQGDVEWRNGTVYISGRAFSPLKVAEGTAWLPVRDVAQAFGWSVQWDKSGLITLQKAHTGARVLSGGIAELAPGELVFPPNLAAKLERLIAVLERWSGVGPQVSFNGPLFQAEKVGFEDRTDMDIFARTLLRAARGLALAKGV
ncbi:MAG: hypothetical protein ACPLRW_07155 [Moorellales bacterium]